MWLLQRFILGHHVRSVERQGAVLVCRLRCSLPWFGLALVNNKLIYAHHWNLSINLRILRMHHTPSCLACNKHWWIYQAKCYLGSRRSLWLEFLHHGHTNLYRPASVHQGTLDCSGCDHCCCYQYRSQLLLDEIAEQKERCHRKRVWRA